MPTIIITLTIRYIALAVITITTIMDATMAVIVLSIPIIPLRYIRHIPTAEIATISALLITITITTMEIILTQAIPIRILLTKRCQI